MCFERGLRGGEHNPSHQSGLCSLTPEVDEGVGARQAAERGAELAVVFNLVSSFLGAKARHFGFMLRGLKELDATLAQLGIPFFLLKGQAEETVPALAAEVGASLLVTDFSPLRIGRQWREGVRAALTAHAPRVALHEVDAHNVVPCWAASEKLEYAARTIRTKINRILPEYLTEYPPLERPARPWSRRPPPPVAWDDLIAEVLEVGAEVPEVEWIIPGEAAGRKGLLGDDGGFLTKRLRNYSEQRNDPSKPGALSGLSPWLHYGQLSAQRCALEARKQRSVAPKAADAFLEELVVRSELSDNFCYYQPEYDSLAGAWDWARATLAKHADDPREHLYTREQLELGKTADKLWNAGQLEMVHYGKMHGFMRMYWAKKILEWTSSPAEALEIAIYLNDKYELDGRDSNGYVGCMWSICGVHDQGWGERPVFGKIRYMNLAGCKRKFNVDGYIQYVDKMMALVKKGKKEKGAPASAGGPGTRKPAKI